VADPSAAKPTRRASLNPTTFSCVAGGRAENCGTAERTADEILFACGINDVLYFWTSEPVYDLRRNTQVALDLKAIISVAASAALQDPPGVHIAFSADRQRWGDPAPDALTVMISPQRLWLRTGLFQNFLPAPNATMSANEWHDIRVLLSEAKLTVELDGKQIADTSLNPGTFPMQGYAGLVFWAPTFGAGQCEIRQRELTLSWF
jgi:hypothetical protein